jgi:hypothetical protein
MFDFCYAIKAIDSVAATTDGRIVSSAVIFYDPVTKLGEFDPVATHQQFQQARIGQSRHVDRPALVERRWYGNGRHQN